ncbi:RIN2 [Scenedesmus sp. PABB004]|nr:RIN2 [Scenedesmus sp. PABB004]
MPPSLFIFGLGYTTTAVARQATGDPWRASVTSTARDPERFAGITSASHRVLRFALERRGVPLDDGGLVALRSSSYVLTSVPPLAAKLYDPVLAAQRRALRAATAGPGGCAIRGLGYLSSTGVYGDWGGAWVDESSEARTATARGLLRREAELAWAELAAELSLPLTIFRLGGIYGPRRSVLHNLQSQASPSASAARRGRQRFTSRCHVADVAAAVLADMARRTAGGGGAGSGGGSGGWVDIVNVVDDEPAPRGEVEAFARQLLGLPPLALEPEPDQQQLQQQQLPEGEAGRAQQAQRLGEPPADAPRVRRRSGGEPLEEKRVANTKLKALLGGRLRAPSFREGLALAAAGDEAPFAPADLDALLGRSLLGSSPRAAQPHVTGAGAGSAPRRLISMARHTRCVILLAALLALAARGAAAAGEPLAQLGIRTRAVLDTEVDPTSFIVDLDEAVVGDAVAVAALSSSDDPEAAHAAGSAQAGAAAAKGEQLRAAAAAAGIALTRVSAFGHVMTGLAVGVGSAEDGARLAELLRSDAAVRAVRPVLKLSAPLDELRGRTLDEAVGAAAAGPAADAAGSAAEPSVWGGADEATLVGAAHARYSGAGVRVAVIDDGLDYTHPAFGACARIGAGGRCRVVAGRDFTDGDQITYDVCGSHGTHVAGIIAGDARGGASPVPWQGVAPEAVLGAYRVFACDGTTTNEWLLSALEAAVRDRMQIINLSMGTNFAAPLGVEFTTRLARQGVIVVAAAGNSGADGLWSYGAPASEADAVSVGSTDNSLSFGAALTIDSTIRVRGEATSVVDAPARALMANRLPPLPSALALPSPRSACAPVSAASVAGRIALVPSGDCAESDKASFLLAAGAVGVVFYDNRPFPAFRQALNIDESVGRTAPQMFAIDLDTGLALARALERGERIRVTRVASKRFRNPNADAPSWFSSWGPTADLRMLPTFSAPGGGILSSIPGGNFALYQGTSMATPYASGALALWRQARRGGLAGGRAVLDAAKASFISTAAPVAVKGDERWMHPVVVAGAGLIQVRSAIDNPVTVAPAFLPLPTGRSSTVSLSLTNTGDRPVAYRLGHDPALAVSTAGAWYGQEATLRAAARVGFRNNADTRDVAALVLAPGATERLRVSVALTEPLSAAPLVYSGYLRLSPISPAFADRLNAGAGAEAEVEAAAAPAGDAAAEWWWPALSVPYMSLSAPYSDLPAVAAPRRDVPEGAVLVPGAAYLCSLVDGGCAMSPGAEVPIDAATLALGAITFALPLSRPVASAHIEAYDAASGRLLGRTAELAHVPWGGPKALMQLPEMASGQFWRGEVGAGRLGPGRYRFEVVLGKPVAAADAGAPGLREQDYVNRVAVMGTLASPAGAARAYAGACLAGLAFCVHKGWQEHSGGVVALESLRPAGGGGARALLDALLKTQLGVFVFGNCLLACCVLTSIAATSLFLGSLSPAEAGRLTQRLVKYLLIKVALVGMVVLPTQLELLHWLPWLAVIGELKMFVGLSKDRLAGLSVSPAAGLGRHVRTLALLGLVLATNAAGIGLLAAHLGRLSWSVALLFGLDMGITAVDAARATLSCVALLMDELLATAPTPDADGGGCSGGCSSDCGAAAAAPATPAPAPPAPRPRLAARAAAVWEGWAGAGRDAFMYRAELGADVAVHLLTLAHHGHVWLQHGLSFHLLDALLLLDTRAVLLSALRRLRAHSAHAAATARLDGAFPDAPPALAAAEECVVCRDRLTAGAKQLPCGHLVHLPCLRAWQDAAGASFSCPVCRAPLRVAAAGAALAERTGSWEPGAAGLDPAGSLPDEGFDSLAEAIAASLAAAEEAAAAAEAEAAALRRLLAAQGGAGGPQAPARRAGPAGPAGVPEPCGEEERAAEEAERFYSERFRDPLASSDSDGGDGAAGGLAAAGRACATCSRALAALVRRAPGQQHAAGAAPEQDPRGASDAGDDAVGRKQPGGRDGCRHCARRQQAQEEQARGGAAASSSSSSSVGGGSVAPATAAGRPDAASQVDQARERGRRRDGGKWGRRRWAGAPGDGLAAGPASGGGGSSSTGST